MNKPFVQAIILCVLIVSTLVFDERRSFAQVDVVARWLDADTAAVAFTDNPQALAERIREFPIFEDSQFQKAIELAGQEPNPLFHSEKLEQLNEQLDTLIDLSAGIEQLYFVCHDATAQQVSYSILINADPDVVQDLSGQLSQLFRLLSTCREAVHQEEDSSQTPDANRDDADNLQALGLFRRQTSDWLLLGNSRAALDQLIRGIDGMPIKNSLAESRVFRATTNYPTMPGAEDGLIFAFLRPEALRPFFENIDDKTWTALRVNELPGAAFQIEIRDTNPLILVSGILKFTKPAAGVGRQFLAYEPIEQLPRIPFEIMDFHGFSRDPQAYREATGNIYDEIHGEQAYETRMSKRYTDVRGSYFEEILNRSQSRFTLRSEDQNGRVRAFVVEKVRDFESMEKFVSSLIGRQNEHRSKISKIQELEMDEDYGFQFWGQSDEALFKKYKQLNPEGKKTRQEIGSQSFGNIGFALSDEWYLQGDISGLQKIAAALIGAEADEGSYNLEEAIRRHEEHLGFKNSSFRVQVDSSIAYEDWVANHMDRFLLSKFPGYRVGEQPPSELVKWRREIRDGNYSPGDPNDMRAYLEYLLLRSALNTFQQRITLYAHNQSNLQFGIAISGKPSEETSSKK